MNVSVVLFALVVVSIAVGAVLLGWFKIDALGLFAILFGGWLVMTKRGSPPWLLAGVVSILIGIGFWLDWVSWSYGGF